MPLVLDEEFAALPAGWRAPLQGALGLPSTRALVGFVEARLAQRAEVYPPAPLAALQIGSPLDVRVVILGQDPYHGPGQAHGYAFSVPEGVKAPPSLRNILAERNRLFPGMRTSGCLLDWSRQGVLLLNAVLTVERGKPASHAGRGWEPITDAVVEALAGDGPRKVFMLWGAHAQAKRARIESARRGHLVLEANHPSPLSARRPPVPFAGCGHFALANEFLLAQGRAPIAW